MNAERAPIGDRQLKQCCAQLYESEFARILLGDSFHPGGLRLTERLGTLLGLAPPMRVLDVASGAGSSAFFVAERFGCKVTGIDFGQKNVERANQLAAARGLADRVQFKIGDAERLSLADACFDAVLCECAYCTFPNKSSAAREFARVLRPGGYLGLSDVTRSPVLPEELNGLLASIACIAEAESVEGYAAHLHSADLNVEVVEFHDEALSEMVRQIRVKLLGAEILVGLKKLTLPGVDFASAKRLAGSALAAIEQGQIGYAIFIGRKRASED